MGLDRLRNEIELMRRQILRQRKEIQTLQRSGISTVAADGLLRRMQDKVDGLCVDRDRLVGESRLTAEGRRTYAGTGKVMLGTAASRRELSRNGSGAARKCRMSD